jgi:hypothetical protein
VRIPGADHGGLGFESPENARKVEEFFLKHLKHIQNVPLIHCTDLFTPPDDFDDHFDLACLFGMSGIELRAVVLDRGDRQKQRPGKIAVEQLDAITGRKVPPCMGLSKNLAAPGDKVLDDAAEYQQGVEAILRILRESDRPVSIDAVGSCRDVAAALNREPELFRRKLGRLMIFIGNSDDTFTADSKPEYNVALDPKAFARILRSGLPVYWVPCFGSRGSFWVAPQKQLLSRCAPAVQQYFVFAPNGATLLGEKRDPLAFVREKPDPAMLGKLLEGNRNLWCTAVFHALAGRKLIRDGDRWTAVPENERPDAEPVFRFTETLVTVNDEGRTQLGPSPTATKVMLFEKTNPKQYAAPMTQATCELLRGIDASGAGSR